jgi:hypothetical protein
MGSWAQSASMSSGEALSTVEMVCEGQRRSSSVVNGSPDGEDWEEEPPTLPPLRESTKFLMMELTSPEGAAL